MNTVSTKKSVALYVGLAYLLAALAIVVAVWIYSRAERCLWYWDGVNFWDRAVSLATVLQSEGLGSALYQVWLSMFYYEWSSLSVFHVAVVGALLNHLTRLTFLLSVALPFLLAISLALHMFVKSQRLRAQQPVPIYFGLIPLALALLCPPFWIATLRGYTDAGGIALCLVCFYLYFSDSSEAHSFTRNLSIAFVLLLIGVFRRPYFIWVGTFLAIVLTENCVTFHSEKKRSLKLFISKTKTFFVIAGALILPSALIALSYARHIDTKGILNRITAHRAGDAGSLTIIQSFLTDNLGLLQVFVFCASVWIVLAHKKHSRLVFLLLLQQVLILLVFANLQDIGVHHTLLFLPGAFVIVALATLALVEKKPPIPARILVLSLGVGAELFVLLGSVWPHFYWSINSAAIRPLHLMPLWVSHPCQTPHMSSFLALHRYLDALPIHNANPCPIHILASGHHLNASKLNRVELSLTGSLSSDSKRLFCEPPVIVPRGEVPASLLSAQYVVVPSKPETHLEDPVHRKFLETLTHTFLNKLNIARSFERLETVLQIDPEIKVFVFKKTTLITEGQYYELRALLKSR